jgi:hypothetical protein
VKAASHFFQHPVLNNPCEQPSQHWELKSSVQPTPQILPYRRYAEFIAPIPKPPKRKGRRTQEKLVFNEGKALPQQPSGTT